MKKTFEGKVVSLKMTNTAVVEIVRRSPHPLYKKLMRISKKFKADKGEHELKIGDIVRIVEVSPISKGKQYKVTEVVK